MPAVSPSDSMDDAAFRALLREFVEVECPPDLRHRSTRMRRAEVAPWTAKLAARGWIAPGWPAEFGGMGLSVARLLAFQEEFDRLGVPRAPDMGVVMLGPLLIRFGTDAQRARFLPPILRGEEVWCQGYSEPNSGSDLASLRTEAVLDGEHYIVNGQKTWTTLAQDADWIFLLVRTDKTVKKQQGISFLLADLATPGITRRPIRTLSGEEEFCEVFFDNVRVPVANLVGKLNDGWTMAKALLGFERIFLGSPKQSQTAMTRLEAVARAVGAFEDARFVDRYAQLHMDVAHLTALYSRFADQLKRGEALGPEVSALKLFAAPLYQRITELTVEVAAEQGIIDGPGAFGNERVDPLAMFHLARPATIYGGSSEIQRNILAKTVLDLPDA
jgi:alkylation response protein AidB-like acyl-CoA dehydrogenase